MHMVILPRNLSSRRREIIAECISHPQSPCRCTVPPKASDGTQNISVIPIMSACLNIPELVSGIFRLQKGEEKVVAHSRPLPGVLHQTSSWKKFPVAIAAIAPNINCEESIICIHQSQEDHREGTLIIKRNRDPELAALRKALKNGNANLPDDASLPGTEDVGVVPYTIVEVVGWLWGSLTRGKFGVELSDVPGKVMGESGIETLEEEEDSSWWGFRIEVQRHMFL
ncbi:hypothetical protein SKAU_G00271440 [Synaphobranchus kaupii]|uniref:Uncharacterized protein n=1 Tax=Synaphobranchus kaupii TaxID=118154 RepID=A0A9Q1IPQ1_SYNKA|nr:hypothetical protein SKAU_G00271440 [Synaphobranchus kaupii]